MVGNGLLHNRRLRPYHIQTYRTQIWRGEEVYYEPEFLNIVFAKDGEIYDLDGKKAIAIGGAYSRDKEYRLLTGLPWFPDEQPDDKVKSLDCFEKGKYYLHKTESGKISNGQILWKKQDSI